MTRSSLPLAVFFLAWLLTVQSMRAASFYTLRPDDPKAIYLTPEAFGAKGDGVADDSDAIQAAINKVVDTTKKGIVLIPEGKYRISKTIYVYNGIRLIGYGKNRPTMFLAAKTPGFQELGAEKGPGAPSPGKYMFHFVADRAQPGAIQRDANPGTFYSAFSNIDIEIAEGNPAAVGIRSHWAQHCFVSHCEFRLGSARAGVEQVGNEIEDCQFLGGDYGLWTTKPSPSWPFLLIDSSFDGQKKAAISTEEGGMTIIRCAFADAPTAILVHEDRAEELIMKECTLHDFTGPAIIVSDDKNARSQTNLINLSCQNVPTLVQFRESGKTITGAADSYSVDNFTHGNQIADFGAAPEYKTTIKMTPNIDFREAIDHTDIAKLPSMDTWVSVLKYGAKGDGVTDDTEAFKKAIAESKTLYLPTGRYKVTDTLALKADTIFVALSPYSTQIFIPDEQANFSGAGDAKALIEAPKGGTNVLMGLGLDAGNNTRAVACKWMAGKDSMISDVRFVGGHGTYHADGTGIPAYNKDRTGDGDPKRVWNSQPASLWIADGGGGTFKDIWTPAPLAHAGIFVENTETPGHLYAISSEHHVKNELIFHNVKNWEAYAIQCEEERAEGPECLPLEITDCENLTFGNLYLYRVNMPQPYISGVKIKNSKNITFRGVHAYSPGKNTYDNNLMDVVSGELIRSREIALLTVTGNPPPRIESAASKIFAGAEVKIATGYEDIDNLAVDSEGRVYFLDRHPGKIFRYDPVKKEITLVTTAVNPTGLFLDTKDNLMVVLNNISIWAIDPRKAGDALKEIAPKPMPEKMPPEITAFVHPQTRWKDDHDFLIVTQQLGNPLRPQRRFRPGDGPPAGPTPPGLVICPDGVTAVPQTGDLNRAYAFTRVTPGKPAYIADEFGQKTYRFQVEASGALSKPELICEEGECGVAVDANGNVYVPAGDLFIFDPKGKLLETVRLPERPTSIAIGGKEGKTLYIAARSSLYAMPIK